MNPTGVVDYNTWLLVQSLAGNIATELSNDNFQIKMQTPPGVYNIADANLITELPLFNVTASCDNHINIKASAICIYDDGTSETLTKTVAVKEPQVLSLQDFQNAFVYNPKHGKQPVQVDYIVYPYNKKSYKWTIMYS